MLFLFHFFFFSCLSFSTSVHCFLFPFLYAFLFSYLTSHLPVHSALTVAKWSLTTWFYMLIVASQTCTCNVKLIWQILTNTWAPVSIPDWRLQTPLIIEATAALTKRCAVVLIMWSQNQWPTLSNHRKSWARSREISINWNLSIMSAYFMLYIAKRIKWAWQNDQPW